MFKEDNYEQIFTNKINKHNMDIIKKFFVFQPAQHTQSPIKPYTSLSTQKNMPNQSISIQTSTKKGVKFPAGFHGSLKFGDIQEQQNNMIIKSKKAPTKQLSSFLLGLNGKVDKQAQPKVQQLIRQKDNLSKTSPQKKKNIANEEAIVQLSKARRQSRRKMNFQCYYSQERATNYQFPKLERKSSQINKKTSIATPTINNSPLNPRAPSQIKQFEIERQRQWKICTSPNKYTGNRLSVKIFKPAQQPIFKKGYLIYEESSKQFIEQNISRIQENPRIKKKIPGITAQYFIAIDKYSLEILVQRKSDQSIQIASLTKIMTCYLCILVCKKYSINMDTHIIRVTDKAAQMIGTSAQLQAGDLISINNLLYGLMLPSGNDASVAIAEGVGKIIQKYKYKNSKKTFYQIFIYQMNMLAKEIGIQQEFQNSSGLSQYPNFSSPKSISILTALAMKNSKFTSIINCKEKQIQIKNQRFGLTRKQYWKNTNKLLWKQGWKGVKTGTTETAGHCLMSCRQNFLISVYNCETLGKRFSECNKIYEFLIHEI